MILQEEDFCPSMFGFATAPDVSDDAMRALCATAEERVAQDATAHAPVLPFLRWLRAHYDACAILVCARGANELRPGE